MGTPAPRRWLSQAALEGLTYAGHGVWAAEAEQHILRVCHELGVTPVAALNGGIKGAVLRVQNTSGASLVLKVTPQVIAEVELRILRSVTGNSVPTILAETRDGFLMPDHGRALDGSPGNRLSASVLADISDHWNQPTNLPLPAAEGYMDLLFSAAEPKQSAPLVESMISHARHLLKGLPAGSLLVHGDLHPGNVLVDDSGHLTIIDPLGMLGTAECEIGQAAAMSHATTGIYEYVEAACRPGCLDVEQALAWTLVRVAVSAGDNLKAGLLSTYQQRLVKYAWLRRRTG